MSCLRHKIMSLFCCESHSVCVGLFRLASLCFNRNLILPVCCNWDTPIAVVLALSPLAWRDAGNWDNSVIAVKGNSFYLKFFKILLIGHTQNLAQNKVFLRKRSQTGGETGRSKVFKQSVECVTRGPPLCLDAFFWPQHHLPSSFSKLNNYNMLLVGPQEKRLEFSGGGWQMIIFGLEIGHEL